MNNTAIDITNAIQNMECDEHAMMVTTGKQQGR